MNIAVATIGFCAASAAQQLDLFQRRDWRALVSLPGDYVLRFATQEGETLVSSLYAVQPYFLGPQGRHGASVAALSGGGIDPEALATLIALSHTVDAQTLAADVRRMPAAAICRWNGSDWAIETLASDSFHPIRRSKPGDALDAFRAAVAACAGASPVVSLSGGFDSRAILAATLAAGLHPALLSMGGEEAGDVSAARALAALCDLPLTVRPLYAQAYFDNASQIARLTDGQKAADHWHSWFYARDNGFAAGAHLLVGANGEFARSYYLDRFLLPLAAPLLDLAAAPAKRLFWRAKLARAKFSPQQIALLPPPLRQALSPEAVRTRADMLATLCPGGLFDGLDWFYLQQRVRHFIGYGMRLIGDSMQWRSPFLDRDWIAAVAGLPRRWKSGSNWHRFAIANLAPKLMAIPESGYAGPMRAHAPPWRALTWRKADKGKPYADYRRWFAGAPAADALASLRPQLAPVFGEALLTQIEGACRSGQARADTVGLLLAFGQWRRQP